MWIRQTRTERSSTRPRGSCAREGSSLSRPRRSTGWALSRPRRSGRRSNLREAKGRPGHPPDHRSRPRRARGARAGRVVRRRRVAVRARALARTLSPSSSSAPPASPRAWGEGPTPVGIRSPDHPVARALLEALGELHRRAKRQSLPGPVPHPRRTRRRVARRSGRPRHRRRTHRVLGGESTVLDVRGPGPRRLAPGHVRHGGAARHRPPRGLRDGALSLRGYRPPFARDGRPALRAASRGRGSHRRARGPALSPRRAGREGRPSGFSSGGALRRRRRAHSLFSWAHRAPLSTRRSGGLRASPLRHPLTRSTETAWSPSSSKASWTTTRGAPWPIVSCAPAHEEKPSTPTLIGVSSSAPNRCARVRIGLRPPALAGMCREGNKNRQDARAAKIREMLERSGRRVAPLGVPGVLAVQSLSRCASSG